MPPGPRWRRARRDTGGVRHSGQPRGAADPGCLARLAHQLVGGHGTAGLPVLPTPERHANLTVLHSAGIPSVLIEMGFLSNLGRRGGAERSRSSRGDRPRDDPRGGRVVRDRGGRWGRQWGSQWGSWWGSWWGRLSGDQRGGAPDTSSRDRPISRRGNDARSDITPSGLEGGRRARGGSRWASTAHPGSCALGQEVGSGDRGRPTYRENLAHVCGEHSAIVRRKARQGTPLVPGNRQRLPQGAASVGETDNTQSIAVALELGGNDRHAVSRLGKRQQSMRIATFEHDRRLQSRHSAGRVKGAAKSESAVHQQQRKGRRDGQPRWCDGDRAASTDGKPPAAPPIRAEGCRNGVRPA